MSHIDEKFNKMRCLVEIMGHKRLVGLVTEEEHGGTIMLRIDTVEFSQYFTAQAVFSITPLTQKSFDAMISDSTPPLTEWEISAYADLRNKYDALCRQHREIREKFPEWEPSPELEDPGIPF